MSAYRSLRGRAKTVKRSHGQVCERRWALRLISALLEHSDRIPAIGIVIGTPARSRVNGTPVIGLDEGMSRDWSIATEWQR